MLKYKHPFQVGARWLTSFPAIDGVEKVKVFVFSCFYNMMKRSIRKLEIQLSRRLVEIFFKVTLKKHVMESMYEFQTLADLSCIVSVIQITTVDR